MSLPRVHVITTGGTIAGKATPAGEVVPGLEADDLLARVPGASAVAHLTTERAFNVASAFIGFDQMLTLARRIHTVLTGPSHDGVVVTHGTGALEQTAYFLDVTLGLDRPVVVTGAMRNPTLPADDGPLNLLNAIHVAASAKSRGLGVLVVMNGVIHAARDVAKVHSSRADAFQSPEFGPLGAIDEDHVHYARRPYRRLPAVMPPAITARVERIPFGAGGSDLFLKTAVDAGVDGIVLEQGRLTPRQLDLVTRALAQGTTVVMCNPHGWGRLHRNTYRHRGGESHLLELGVIFAGTPALKARVKLTILLSAGMDRERIRDLFHAEWD
ncbi:MAG: asparaginase [Armatimonadota bacterium]|nr:asparaginase [Armatimonadota bacterium]